MLMYMQELHLHAAMKVMVKLEPPLKKDNPNPNLTEWLNYMRRSQNAITSILSLKSFSEVAQQARCHYAVPLKLISLCYICDTALHSFADIVGKGYVELSCSLSMSCLNTQMLT